MRKFLGILPVLALVAFAPRANASLAIYYSINGGAATFCNSGPDDGPVSCSIINAVGAGGSVINAAVVTSTSNSPGTPAGSDQLGDTVQVTSTGSNTLDIFISAQDFTMPTTNLSYESSLSATSTLQSKTTTSVAGLMSCIDEGNGIATSAPLTCAGGSITNLNESLTGNTSSANTVDGVVNALTTPYALQQMLSLTLVKGSNFNVVTSQSLEPVPEPTSVILLGSFIVGFATLLRRKVARQS